MLDVGGIGGQKAPSAKRCIKTSSLSFLRVSIFGVRKHRAPKGALRRGVTAVKVTRVQTSQKAPSAKRCIKTWPRPGLPRDTRAHRQKAPSAKRCIKTSTRRRRASRSLRGQKAPSAKRCIKTAPMDQRHPMGRRSQKAPSAKRCIKTVTAHTTINTSTSTSESTERQKVH